MAVEIEHSKLSDRLAMSYSRQIVRGELQPGHALPAEPELAATLGISKPVVRESLRHLASLGLVRVHHGKRTVVLDPSEWNVLDPLVQDAFRLEGRGHELAVQLYDLRVILETSSAARASSRATPEQIHELAHLAAQLREIATVTRDPDEFLRVDRMFHDLVARASGNEALRQVIRNVHTFLTVAWAPTSIDDDELEMLVEMHEQIAEAIGARDAERAEAAMDRHLQRAAGKVIDQFTREGGRDDLA